MKYNFIWFIKNIDPHTLDQISFQTQTCVVGRPPTNKIHNKMDQPNPNRQSKCSYYRNKEHHKKNCPYRQ